MNLEDFFPIFIEESREKLAEMEDILQHLEQQGDDVASLNALFRAVHTIKGSGATFGLDHIVDFTHMLENILDQARKGDLCIDAELTALLLKCRDHIANLIDSLEIQGVKPPSGALSKKGASLLEQLKKYHHEDIEMIAPDFIDIDESEAIETHWQDDLQDEIKPSLTDVSIDENFPSTLSLQAAEFFPPSTLSEKTNLSDEIELLSIVENEKITQPIKESKRQDNSYIKVLAHKLDSLINLVGELVIAGAGANLMVKRLNDPALVEITLPSLLEFTSDINQLVEQIRDNALDLRMVEIGETFNRFRRVVRDVSHELGKEIDFCISGGEAGLDKTVVEKISDPLMHLIRNAIDHGIEPIEVRRARGKPDKGTLSLNAYHDSGSIVIEVSDDGGGLNRDKILNRAIEKGIIPADQNISDHEVYQLIFEPGFSTAEKVTQISGRGVGMDVVKQNILGLRGTVELESEAGVGSKISIRLPLTLAIIDGFLVGVGKRTYVLPLDRVVECAGLSKEEKRSAFKNNYINLRGEVLPFLRLRTLFSTKGKPKRRESLVVVESSGIKVGLVVDELLGEFQTVIKPLGQLFSNLQGISGATILGGGDVALIIDVPGLIQLTMAREKAQHAKL